MIQMSLNRALNPRRYIHIAWMNYLPVLWCVFTVQEHKWELITTTRVLAGSRWGYRGHNGPLMSHQNVCGLRKGSFIVRLQSMSQGLHLLVWRCLIATGLGTEGLFGDELYRRQECVSGRLRDMQRVGGSAPVGHLVQLRLVSTLLGGNAGDFLTSCTPHKAKADVL